MVKRKKVSQRSSQVGKQKKKKYDADRRDHARSEDKRRKIVKRQEKQPKKKENTDRQLRRSTELLTWTDCLRCGARLLKTESAGFCCKNYTSDPEHLIELPLVPYEFEKLCVANKDLRRDGRKYNNLFAMSAMGWTGSLQYAATGLSNLTLIHGRIYHRMLNGNRDRSPLR